MVAACKEMAVYCFDTLEAHYSGKSVPLPSFEGGDFPLFVTWKKVTNGGAPPRLRGCIGTLEARCVITGFKDYALIRCRHVAQFCHLSVGKHGIIVEFVDPTHNARRSATYLPDVLEQEGWTQLEAIDSSVRKAGYTGPISDALRLTLKVTRYQSSLYTLSYGEYADYVRRTRGAAAAASRFNLAAC
eukprot:jgi/Mesen1/2806/ME000172S01952